MAVATGPTPRMIGRCTVPQGVDDNYPDLLVSVGKDNAGDPITLLTFNATLANAGREREVVAAAIAGLQAFLADYDKAGV